MASSHPTSGQPPSRTISGERRLTRASTTRKAASAPLPTAQAQWQTDEVAAPFPAHALVAAEDILGPMSHQSPLLPHLLQTAIETRHNMVSAGEDTAAAADNSNEEGESDNDSSDGSADDEQTRKRRQRAKQMDNTRRKWNSMMKEHLGVPDNEDIPSEARADLIRALWAAFGAGQPFPERPKVTARKSKLYSWKHKLVDIVQACAPELERLTGKKIKKGKKKQYAYDTTDAFGVALKELAKR
eukprot:TRINITY_DN453_c0_g2_i1.p1 TRINITY_DN453_c0_g2~~TRINITY_DN453_c0_g2_i1.p1  ORF type:complete len:243 (+),score=63.80 TRINITY_DN453_c0_g2_i1:615-1343(+)